LTQCGAEVIGVDLSADLIEIAQGEEFSNDIKYIVDDAQTLSSIEDEHFDLVVCNLALMDIPDLHKTLKTVWRILRTEGTFVFSITHPCFEAPHAQWVTAPDGKVSREISNYVEEGFWRSNCSEGVRGKVGAQHRMLSTYINTLAQTGFRIIQIVEPVATTDEAKQAPRFQSIPAFMLMRCRKVSLL
jgi:SAM-dependent methyltransferase